MGALATLAIGAAGAALNYRGQKQQEKGNRAILQAQRDRAETDRQEALLRRQEQDRRFRRERRGFFRQFFERVGQNTNAAATSGALASSAGIAGQQAPANTLAANVGTSNQYLQDAETFFGIQSDRADISTRAAVGQAQVDEGTATKRLGTQLFSNAKTVGSNLRTLAGYGAGLFR